MEMDKLYKKFIVSENLTNQRIDIAICKNFPDLTRSFLHKIFLKNQVFVNNKPIYKHYKTKINDEIKIIMPEPVEFSLVPQNISLDIVYEDEFLLVVNKPKGMVVHPAPGNETNTLVNALLWHCNSNLSNIGGLLRPGIVHRIDKDTSGLLIIAKTDEAYYNLTNQIKEHSIIRIYEAIVYGNFKKDSDVLNYPIGRSKTDRKKMAVRFDGGKPAITHFKVLKQFKNFSHLKLKLETGRTHQIRVHLAYIGHPIVGDETYGPRNGLKLNGQCLHSKTIDFYHFKLKKRLFFDSELDITFKKFLNKFD